MTDEILLDAFAPWLGNTQGLDTLGLLLYTTLSH